MDIGTIRTALKDAIKSGVSQINVDDLREHPDVGPGGCAIVYPDPPFALDLTIGDNSAQIPKFIVLLLVPYVDTKNAQTKLDELISTEGERSVKLAIEGSANNLGDVVSYVGVTEISSYQVTQMTDGGTKYLSAELAVEIYA